MLKRVWGFVFILILVSLIGCGSSEDTVDLPDESVDSDEAEPAALPPSSLDFTYETRPDGAMLISIPPAGSSDQNPTFSPDSQTILFTRFDNGYNEGPAGLYLLNLETGEIIQHFWEDDQDAVNMPGTSWNPTANRITFASDRADHEEVWTMQADGSDLFRVTDHAGTIAYAEPTYSPDGEWIAFQVIDFSLPENQQQGSIWKVRADGSDLTPLADGPTDDRQPNWSPTGDRILFQRRQPDGEEWDLYTIKADGTNEQSVTSGPSDDTDASWAPDGNWIVYSSNYGDLDVPNIFAVPADGGEPVRITHDDTRYDGAVSWSPDGQWIAFESYEGDDDQPSTLWIIPAPDLMGGTAEGSSTLADVSHWFYMIDVNLEQDMVDQVAESNYDLVVFDFIPSEENNTDYPMAEVIDQLHNAPHPKLVLAYIDIGQAEEWRTYWQPGWGIGSPEWIVALDPDGWEGNYPVMYWHDEWQDIWLGKEGYLQTILDLGFDGIYLDWVEAYSDENVIAAAEREGVDPQQEMIWWVESLAEFARSQDPNFIVIGQNAAELAEDDDYLAIIDAIAQEQTWFDGSADNDPPGDCPLPRTETEIDTDAYYESLSPDCQQQYDEFPDSTLHVSSEEYLYYLTLAQSKGTPIFTIDYAVEPDNIAWIVQTSRELGFIPFVSNRALDQFVEPVP